MRRREFISLLGGAAASPLAARAATPATAGGQPRLDSFAWSLNKAAGARPLLVIWIRQPDGAPPEKLAGYRRYYPDIVFGRSGSAPTPGQPDAGGLSVVDYYREVSNGRFGWTRAGFVGPLTGQVKIPITSQIAPIAIEAAAREGKFNFKAFDRNGDRKITSEELTVLVIANSKFEEAQSGSFAGRPIQIPGQDVAFAGNYSIVGEGGSFASMNHELFHGIAPAARDIYGYPQNCLALNFEASLMGATITAGRDARITFHPDAWLKTLVGWIEPRLYAMQAPGATKLAAQHIPLSSEPVHKRPILLFDRRKGSSEFFLLEYRTPNASGYDRNVADSGLMIWHVLLNDKRALFLIDADRKNCHGETLKVWSLNVRGAPNGLIGVSRAYTAAHGPVAVKWWNVVDSGVRVRVEPHDRADPLIGVSWTVAKAPL